jgi:hypothetical protein
MPDDLNRLEEDGEDLLKGIIDHPDDDDALGDDDGPHIDDFDIDEDTDQVVHHSDVLTVRWPRRSLTRM